MIDGAAGWTSERDHLQFHDDAERRAHVARVQAAAAVFR
jgi:hypothetical protein